MALKTLKLKIDVEVWRRNSDTHDCKEERRATNRNCYTCKQGCKMVKAAYNSQRKDYMDQG
jgi:hypothetical protein